MQKKILFACIFWVLSGCGTKIIDRPVLEPRNLDRSLLFGNLQFSVQNQNLTHIALVAPYKFYLTQRGERLHLYEDGFFFVENLQAGKYRITSVFSGSEGFIFPKEFAPEISVERRSVTYMGSYEIKPIQGGRALQKGLQEPTEMELLEKLRQKTLGTEWNDLVIKRQKELQKEAGLLEDPAASLPSSKPSSSPVHPSTMPKTSPVTPPESRPSVPGGIPPLENTPNF